MPDSRKLPLIGHSWWRKWYFGSGKVYRHYLADFEDSLHLKQRAADDGRNNLPPTDAAEPGPVEHQIDHRFGANVDAIKQARWRTLKDALNRIAQCIPEKLEFKATAEATELAIKRLFDRARSGLAAARKNERDKVKDLKSFQSKNGLKDRSAQYMQPFPMKPLFFILLGLLVDAVLNGAFFAQRSADYWQGGITQALGFSFVNILLGCVLLGLISARYAGHVDTWKRAAGMAGVTFAVFAGLLWNGYVGHYRQLLESVPLDQIDALSGGSYIDAFAHMREHPFALTSWQAIVLLIIGFAIFIAMAVEGYRADDRYPRFGHYDRVHKNALRAYETSQAILKQRVENEIDRATKALRDRIKAEARQVERARHIVSEAEGAEREMQDSAADLARAATAALQTYRETNLFVRTAPPPTYFKTFSSFTVDLAGPELDPIAAKYREAIEALERNRQTANEIEQHLREISKKLNDELARYLEDIENEVARDQNATEFPHAAE